MNENSIVLKANHELLSDEVQEIISYRPHWLVRKGSTVFFIVLIFVLTITWFIKYPDIVNGSIRLVATNMPKQINTRVDGKLEKLLVKNEQEVKQGAPLAFLNSTASHEQVLRLQKWVNELVQYPEPARIGIVSKNPLPQFFNLGELQGDYQQFQNVLVESEQILATGFYERKKRSLQNDLVYLSILQKNTVEQQILSQKDYELQKVEYNAKESLMKDKVIAPLEFNQDKSKLLAKEQSLQQVRSQLVNGELSSHSKQKEVMELEKLVFDQRQKFQSSLLEFKSKIEEWVQKYILIASESGKVLFASSLQENQFLSSNQEIFFIQPQQASYYGELMAAQRGLGKISAGQKVMIKVESFPSSEFGYITGKVEHISNIPNRRDSFLVKVSLPKGLETSYHQTIHFRNNLSGQGEIITNDRKLFDRLTGQLGQVLKR